MSAPRRLVLSGKVAVLISPGFGAGWSTWNTEYPGILFDPEIAQAILDGRPSAEIESLAKRLYPEAYLGGLDQLQVEWVVPGQSFKVHEYDGSESIQYPTGEGWVTA